MSTTKTIDRQPNESELKTETRNNSVRNCYVCHQQIQRGETYFCIVSPGSYPIRRHSTCARNPYKGRDLNSIGSVLYVTGGPKRRRIGKHGDGFTEI